jgi:hypothetical protein
MPLYTAHVHFLRILNFWCIDNARVIYRKIRRFKITSIQFTRHEAHAWISSHVTRSGWAADHSHGAAETDVSDLDNNAAPRIWRCKSPASNTSDEDARVYSWGKLIDDPVEKLGNGARVTTFCWQSETLWIFQGNVRDVSDCYLNIFIFILFIR